MSQQFNDDFNNNQNASDMQNTNNFEDELQQPQPDNAVGSDSVSEQKNSEDSIDDPEQRPKNDNQTENNIDANDSECSAQGITNEESSVTCNPNGNEKEGKDDISDNPIDDFPKENLSSAENVKNNSGTNASDQSNTDISKAKSINNKLIDEAILRKIDAVKEFAFCKKKVSFPFFNEKYNDIPIYPYVAALTGHRDAVITDSVKATAKKQLRSLAQSWDKACKGRSWLIIPKNTAPLIALIGLGDGESGKLWAEIAAELRDEEKYNIKILAVASMPFKDMVNIFSKHTNFLSNKKDFLDAKNSFDYILEKAEGLIELPYNQDVKDYIKLYEDLEKNCTGDNAAHSEELFQILFNGSKAFQDIQYKEYRKYMCVHSHVLLALTENATSWESANLTGIDINELNNDSSDNAISKDSLLIPLKEKDDARKALKELNRQITELKNRGCKPQKFEELIESFKTLAGSLFKKFTEPIPRTNAMIFYKLLGNVDSALIPAKQKVNGISFTSIGPVVCIHTKRKTQGAETENTQNSNDAVTILIKDQPNDTNADLINKITWNNQDISQFYEIKDVIAECGRINQKLFNKSKYSQTTDINEEDVINDFLETLSNDKQLDVKMTSIDKDTLSLIKHHNSAKKLSNHYDGLMKNWTKAFAFLGFLLFSLLGFGTVIGNKNTMVYSNIGIGALLAIIWIYSCFKVHKSYHFFEALASGLKVQIFWNLAGVNEDVPGQFYLHQINEIAWLRVAFNGLLTTESSTSVNNNEVNETSLNSFKLIKSYWIGSSLKQIAGKTDYTFGERNMNIIKKLFQYLPVPNQLKSFFQPLWQARVYIAGAAYLALIPFFRQDTLLQKISAPVFLIFVPAFLKSIFVIVCTALFIFLSLIAVYNAYQKSSLKELDIKRRHQLLYPYRRAELLYGIKIKYWESSLECLQKTEASQNVVDTENSDLKVVNYSYQECQKILEDLGRIELAINAEWLLGLKDREFNLSDAKNEIKLQEYKYKYKDKDKED